MQTRLLDTEMRGRSFTANAFLLGCDDAARGPRAIRLFATNRHASEATFRGRDDFCSSQVSDAGRHLNESVLSRAQARYDATGMRLQLKGLGSLPGFEQI